MSNGNILGYNVGNEIHAITSLKSYILATLKEIPHLQG
jgi:hypothetical protein